MPTLSIENILKNQKPKNKQTAGVVFKLLTELSNDFMIQGREQLPLQSRKDFDSYSRGYDDIDEN